MSDFGKVSLTVGAAAVDRLYAMLGGREGDDVSACDVAWVLDCSVADALELLKAAQSHPVKEVPDRDVPYVNNYGQFIIEG